MVTFLSFLYPFKNKERGNTSLKIFLKCKFIRFLKCLVPKTNAFKKKKLKTLTIYIYELNIYIIYMYVCMYVFITSKTIRVLIFSSSLV
jgi:hypothetical protein